MIFVYRIVINLILILSPLIILVRLLKKKEDFTRFKEKLGFFKKSRSKGKLIWFHGASVGEFQSIVPLLEKLEKSKKISQILITSNTLSSSKVISKISKMSNVKVLDTLGILKEKDIVELNKNNKVKVLGRGDI